MTTVAKPTDIYLIFKLKTTATVTIMQVGVVACLAMKDTPERSAEGSRKDSTETVLSMRGCLRVRAKRSFSECQTIVKIIGI